MIAFTILGLLVFWCWCFQIGYHITPACQLARTGFALWLYGKEVDRFVGYIAVRFPAATAGVNGMDDKTKEPK